MNTSDLKDGDIIVTRNDDIYLRIDGVCHGTDGWIEGIVNCCYNSDYDIVKVFRLIDRIFIEPLIIGKTYKESSLGNYQLIWKRTQETQIEISVKINGKEAKLSDLSEETLCNLREVE